MAGMKKNMKPMVPMMKKPISAAMASKIRAKVGCK